MTTTSLSGLIAATHTPFHADGSLNLAAVERQAEHLLKHDITCAFIVGTTGESSSLTVDERLKLAARWFEVARGTDMRIVVHVGANCLADSQVLARQAEHFSAAAIAALAPSYFKPANTGLLVDCCEQIAASAPNTPFYFYDIPSMTNVSLSMPEFLEKAGSRIPTLEGLKFTNNDLMAYQECMAVADGRYTLLWGIDEMLLAATVCGAPGAVGSTYNFAAAIYQNLLAAWNAGDLDAARAEQLKSIRLVRILCRHGYMASAKALMELLGVPVGPPRLPNGRLTTAQLQELHGELREFGY
ncbi:MAG: dihydrodipicolinate synthase family protein [Planctomyces sp.]|nr:dihydrodipicolinate synthase family protein [Planctomyces sp.]